MIREGVVSSDCARELDLDHALVWASVLIFRAYILSILFPCWLPGLPIVYRFRFDGGPGRLSTTSHDASNFELSSSFLQLQEDCVLCEIDLFGPLTNIPFRTYALYVLLRQSAWFHGALACSASIRLDGCVNSRILASFSVITSSVVYVRKS